MKAVSILFNNYHKNSGVVKEEGNNKKADMDDHDRTHSE